MPDDREITLVVRFDRPVKGQYARERLATDVEQYLAREQWGWGRARVTNVDPAAEGADPAVILSSLAQAAEEGVPPDAIAERAREAAEQMRAMSPHPAAPEEERQ